MRMGAYMLDKVWIFSIEQETSTVLYLLLVNNKNNNHTNIANVKDSCCTNRMMSSYLLFVLCLLLVQILETEGFVSASNAFASPFAGQQQKLEKGRIGSLHKNGLGFLTNRENDSLVLTRVSLAKQSNDEKNMGKITGVDNGVWILGFMMMFSVWMFSIPVEFRRAKNCSAEQVRLYPESRCMTTEMWWGGVIDYYKNGGGVSFDFSIEEQE